MEGNGTQLTFTGSSADEAMRMLAIAQVAKGDPEVMAAVASKINDSAVRHWQEGQGMQSTANPIVALTRLQNVQQQLPPSQPSYQLPSAHVRPQPQTENRYQQDPQSQQQMAIVLQQLQSFQQQIAELKQQPTQSVVQETRLPDLSGETIIPEIVQPNFNFGSDKKRHRFSRKQIAIAFLVAAAIPVVSLVGFHGGKWFTSFIHPIDVPSNEQRSPLTPPDIEVEDQEEEEVEQPEEEVEQPEEEEQPSQSDEERQRNLDEILNGIL